MFRFQPPTALYVLLCAISLHAVGVLADNTAEYSYETIQTTAQQLQSHAIQTIVDLQQSGARAASIPVPDRITLAIFPIKSAVLTPGTVTSMPMSLRSLSKPIFIVGRDELSQKWLQQNIKQLTALHAIGFLVRAENETDFKTMQSLAGGLSLLPINADAFAAQWNLKHYPVLVTAQGIRQ